MKNTYRKNKNLFINILSAYFVKGLSVIIGILLVRAYLRYFSDNKVLGIWYTILSFITWIINFDLGIGQGLRNYSVKSLNENNFNLLKKIVSSAYTSISIFCILILFLSSIIINIINWNTFFDVSNSVISNSTIKIAVFFSLFGIVLQMVLKLIVSIFNAKEKTAIPNFLTLSTNLIIVIFATIYNGTNDSNNLIMLSIVYFIATIVPYLITSIVMFLNKWKKFRPNIKYCDLKISKEIISLSSKFFLVQIFLMVITVTNELFITKLVNVEQVVDYQFYFKIFGTILTFFSLATNPIWSSISKKWEEKNITAVKKLYRFLLIVSMIFSGIAIICYFGLQFIFNLWLGTGVIVVNNTYAIIFLLYTIVMLLSYAVAATANALSLLKTQIYCYFVGAIIKYPLCLLILNINNNWSTIVLVNLIIMLPYAIIQLLVIRKKIINNKKITI